MAQQDIQVSVPIVGIDPSKPVAYAAQVYDEATEQPLSEVASKVDGLAAVATSGSYNDLKDKPTIPAPVDVSGKANKSEMSVTPGTGAYSDRTTIQLKSGTSATVLTQHQDISGKANANDVYTKAEGQAFESSVNAAIETQNTQIEDRLDEQDHAISLLDGHDVIVVADHTAVASPDGQKIYRQPNAASNPTAYTDWMYQNNAWKAIATYTFPGIDNVPTAGSNNLVKSGGVAEKLNDINRKAFGTPIEQSSSILVNSGYIKWADGVLTAGGYHTSDFIPVLEGDEIKVTTVASSSTAAIACYGSDNESSYIQSKSVNGLGGGAQTYTLTIPSGVNYVRVNCVNANLASFSMLLGRDGLKQAISDLQTIITGGQTEHNSSILANTGFIGWSDGVVTGYGYKSSNFIPVEEGDIVTLTTHVSSSVAAIACYGSSNESSYIQSKSVIGSGADGTQTYTLTIPSGVSYIKVDCYNSATFLESFSLCARNEGIANIVPELKEKVEGLENNNFYTTDAYSQPSYLLVKSRCSVNFIFDDSPSQDTQIKAVFDEFGYKCGFAIITGSQRYIDYAKEGFEILAHGSTPLSSADETTIRSAMVAGKKVVKDLGLICHGWVTPSSTLPAALRYVTNDYFEYGFTVYNGSSATGQTMESSMKSHDLWRVHIDTLLTNYQSIFADAIQNDGMVSVYAHGTELGKSGWDLDDLRTILQYCKSNGIDVLTPYKSCLKLFSVRHN